MGKINLFSFVIMFVFSFIILVDIQNEKLSYFVMYVIMI